LVEITDNTNADGLTVDHLPGIGYTSFYGAVVPAASNHNSAGTPATLNNTGVLYDLGPQPVLNQWQVVNNSLVVSNLLGSAGGATPVAEGVVQLKAQYGIDDGAGGAVATDGIISPSEWRTAGPGVPADWSKVLAVRFALLARSSALERAAVTPVAPAWSGGNFDMTGQPANWQNYRYRVFESVVAMRNMLWPKCYPVACS
jgi:type IV pilus assembly protein PilW